MLTDAPTLNSLWGSLIIEELVRNGCGFFCISPGSRSAPLTLAVAQNPKAKSIICYDERGAAYMALGYAKATGRPAVLICTSGTAVANYMPAVIEASVDCVPMFLLTADRPPELRQTGANQTINQVQIFGGYVRWFFDLPCPDEKISPDMVLTTTDQLVFQAGRPPAGPVHLNCMFREPLAPVTHENFDRAGYLAPLDRWIKSDEPFTRYHQAKIEANLSLVREISATIASARNGLVVVGTLHSPADVNAISKLAERLCWPVFADVTSGLKPGSNLSTLIPYHDQILLSGKIRQKMSPDVVLHFGGRMVSKRLLQFLQELQPQKYILVAEHPMRIDPNHQVTDRVMANIADFCTKLAEHSARFEASNEVEILKKASNVVELKLHSLLQNRTDLTEPGVLKAIPQIIPAGTGLFLANSMPVRDMDMYGAARGTAIRVVANRGASGIDGNLATACGFAFGIKKTTTVVLGDLALLHDLNSLLFVKNLGVPIIIIVLNNHGGGIFSFLPVAQIPNYFEPFFATPHDLSFQKAADIFDLPYFCLTQVDEFYRLYQEHLKKEISAVIEIQTDRQENHKFHLKLQQEIVSALEALE